MALATTVILSNALIQKVALEPLITAPLLYLLIRKPQVFRDTVLRRLPSLNDNTALVTALKWLVGLGIGRNISYLMNKWALNNWQLRTTKSQWDWKNEVVVVTGGCSGFGEKVSIGLAEKGLKVVVLDVSDLPKSLQGYSNVAFYKCDITSTTAISEVANTIRSSQGHPSILINNAGIAFGSTILETSNEQVSKIFGVNIISHFALIKEFLPHMIEQNKGHVVTVASMASYLASCNLVDYCCTKAGVLALHQGLTQELKHRYAAPLVKTTIIHPMFAKTGIIKGFEEPLKKAKVPLIPAEVVGDAIIKQVLSGSSGQIYVPPPMGYVSGIRGWPHWMQENMRDGVAKVMGEVVRR